MINIIWVGMLVIGVIVGGMSGRIEQVTAAALQASEAAVSLSFKLIGVMSLWLGIMKIADKSGVIRLCTWLIRPLTRWLFPSIPKDHPALGAIMMLLSANALGLGNAATPLGLKAMQELQKLNMDKETASDAMCTLLALTTAGFTLIPATVIALRSAAGSLGPTEIVATTLMASLTANCAVILCDKCCQRFFGDRGRH
ncbi:MAG: nucleoside recognition domain-containing protein [Bacillota bacterium]|nr:spore maturation protein [Bacillota bacterium]HWR56585.1 nucleoside recognition domain-containing protein [Negativicutes bacterium]